VLLAPPVCTPSTRFIVKIRNSALRAGSATAASRSAAPGTAIASRAIISTPGGNVRHTLMGLLVAVVAATPVAAQDKAAAHGEKVYAAQKCSVCHSIAGKGNAKGPLDNVGAKYSAEELRQWMIAPRVMSEKLKATRKPVMPEYTKLSKEDLDAVVAYLSTLKKP
jgi:mono/diheme cytochrome c family protein